MIILNHPKLRLYGIGIIAGHRTKWRYKSPDGPLAKAKERRYEQNRWGHDPLRFRRERVERLSWMRDFRRGWPRGTRRLRQSAIHLNYAVWIPASDPIRRLQNREFPNEQMRHLVRSSCPNAISKNRRRVGLHGSFDYDGWCRPAWSPASTSWVRLRTMHRILARQRATTAEEIHRCDLIAAIGIHHGRDGDHLDKMTVEELEQSLLALEKWEKKWNRK